MIHVNKTVLGLGSIGPTGDERWAEGQTLLHCCTRMGHTHTHGVPLPNSHEQCTMLLLNALPRLWPGQPEGHPPLLQVLDGLPGDQDPRCLILLCLHCRRQQVGGAGHLDPRNAASNR